MMVVHFMIPGRPKGKDRPRVSQRGGKMHAFTPKPTKEYEKKVRAVFQEAPGSAMITGAAAVRIIAWFPIPKSARKDDRRRMEKGAILPGTRPDIDNLAKVILDGLNGIAFADDSKVASLTVQKRYSSGDGAVEVWVSPVVSEVSEQESR